MTCDVEPQNLDRLTLFYLRKRDVLVKSADYSIADGDDMIVANAEVTITLPTAVGRRNCVFTIKRTDAGAVTIATTGSETIDGTDFLVLNYAEAGAWPSIDVVSDGANWLTF